MEVYDAISLRKSVRAYDPKPVPKEILDRILEAGRIAPSANNAQPWHFVIVRDQAKRDALSKRRWTKFLGEAPVVLVGCGDKKRSPEFHIIDVTIAMQQMVIAATSEGLGTCWIGDFDEEIVKELLDIPEDFEVVCLLAMGFPKEKFDLASKIVRARRRKPVEEIVSYEKFGNSKPE